MGKEENLKKALDKIEKAGTTLSLSQLWLGEVPKEIGKLSKLSKLDLSYNELTGLPDFIFKLERLRHLKLKGNRIEKIPDSIGNLKNLRTLDLEGSRVKKLPDSICKLENLEEMNLESGGLTELPEGIGKLKKLKVLDLGRCPLTNIPESLGDLKDLERFNLTYTNVKTLPDSIGNLPKLEQLSLLYAKLTEIPDQISNLTSLTGLGIAGMEECKSFPDDLSKLTKLKNFFFKDSKLKKIPEGVFTIPNLKFLRMGNNELTEIPEDILRLKKLNGFFFENNKIAEIPDFLSKKNWQTIDLSNNRIGVKSFPGNFGEIKIRNLYLTGNPVSEIDEAPENFSKDDDTKISGIKFKIRRKKPDEFVTDIDKKVKETGKDIENLKEKQVCRINKQLKKWGGKDNQLSYIDDFQAVFLDELLNKKLKNIKNRAKRSFQDFFGDQELKVLMDINNIELPDKKKIEWEITINNRDFSGPLVIFKINGWEIIEETMVG